MAAPLFKALDERLGGMLRGRIGRSVAEDTWWRFAAKKLIYLQVLFFCLVAWRLWQRDAYETKIFLFVTLAAVIANETFSWFVSYSHFRLRPFVTAHKTPLVPMAPFVKSFPSDHATIACTLAWAMWGIAPPTALALLAIALLVGLGRIAAAVHYPTDILGGAILGVAGTTVVFAVVHYFAQLEGITLFTKLTSGI